jgi:hypothetical protein
MLLDSDLLEVGMKRLHLSSRSSLLVVEYLDIELLDDVSVAL